MSALYKDHTINEAYKSLSLKQLQMLWAELIGKPFTPRYLLSKSVKTIKGESRGILTGVVYMSPAKKIEADLYSCSNFIEAECSGPCLAGSGHGGDAQATKARKDRLDLLIKSPSLFFEILSREIFRLEKKAAKEGMSTAYRLNGTTDLRWDRIIYNGRSIFQHYSKLQWYDYTKNIETYKAHSLLGVDMTFSFYRAVDRNVLQDLLDNGGKVAIAYYDEKPLTQRIGDRDYRVIDGDEHDARFLDPKGVIVALKYKNQTFTKRARRVNQMAKEGRFAFIVSGKEAL